jgi:hypothetical protein
LATALGLRQQSVVCGDSRVRMGLPWDQGDEPHGRRREQGYGTRTIPETEGSRQ